MIAFSRHEMPEFFASHRPHRMKRAQGMPGARCTHGPRAIKKHAAEPQVQPKQPAFPAQWFYGLYVISSVNRACLPPSPA